MDSDREERVSERALVVLVENPGWVPSTDTVAHKFVTPVPGDLRPSCPLRPLHTDGKEETEGYWCSALSTPQYPAQERAYHLKGGSPTSVDSPLQTYPHPSSICF